MEPKKLKFSRIDYEFVVSNNNFLYPWEGPGIVLNRVYDGMTVACSNYGHFVGTTAEDESHISRLTAAAHFLTYILHCGEGLGIYSLSDIRPVDIYMYEKCTCPPSEVVYVGEFLYNLSCAGHLLNVQPEDILFNE